MAASDGDSDDLFRVAMLVLEITGLVLVSLLLLTAWAFRIYRLPVIHALLLSLILHALVYIWPSFFHLRLQLDFGRTLTTVPRDTALARFCVSEALLLRYSQVVMAAFFVSFTLAIFDLARRSHASSDRASEHTYSRRSSRSSVARPLSSLALCVAPFLWGLPIFFIPIPYFMREDVPIAHYFLLSCEIPDRTFRIVSDVFILVPLGLATLLSFCVMVYIIKIYTSEGGVLIDLALVIRFAVMALVIIVSTLISITNIVFNGSVAILVKIGVIWESSMPILQFFIFASQKDVLVAWWSLLSCTACASRSSATSTSSSRPRAGSGTAAAFLPAAPVAVQPNPFLPLSLPGSRLSLSTFLRRTPTPTPRMRTPTPLWRPATPTALSAAEKRAEISHGTASSASYLLRSFDRPPPSPVPPHPAVATLATLYPTRPPLRVATSNLDRGRPRAGSYEIPPTPRAAPPAPMSPDSAFFAPHHARGWPSPHARGDSGELTVTPASQSGPSVASYRFSPTRSIPQAREWMARPAPVSLPPRLPR